MTEPQRTDIANILINFLRKARYERLINEHEVQEDQFYATTDGNEQCEYGDLFGNIEDQIDLYNALCASHLYKKDMCNDPRGYAIVKALKDNPAMSHYVLPSTIQTVGEGVEVDDNGIATNFVGYPIHYLNASLSDEIYLSNSSFTLKMDFICPIKGEMPAGYHNTFTS